MKKDLLNIKKVMPTVRQGFSLVEVIIASAILSIIVGYAATGLVRSHGYLTNSGNKYRAEVLAEEGLEAARNIRDNSFANLADGTYGISSSGSAYSFSGSQDTKDIFTRKVYVSTINSKTKEIKSEIKWTDSGGNQTISLSDQLTDWRKIKPLEGEQLIIDVANAKIDPTDHKKVTGVTIENIDTELDITVTEMKISWTGAPGGTNLTGIHIDGNSVWSGSNASGSTEDITDFVLATGHGTYPIDHLDFSNDMTGSTITIIFTMLDGTTKQTVFSPSAPPDTTPPANIINLATSGATTTSINLAWTAPGDDGSSGMASVYDIRYSTSMITNANWASATEISGEPTPLTAGTSQSMTVSGLSPATTYYFAMKTSDEVPNISGLSNVPNRTTLASTQNNYLVVNTASAVVNSGNTRTITGITLQNSGPSNITIATMTVSWSGVSSARRLTRISINGSSKWTGNNNTGVVENITNTTIVSGASAVPMVLTFNNPMNGVTLNLVFTMTDGSTKTVSGIGPL